MNTINVNGVTVEVTPLKAKDHDIYYRQGYWKTLAFTITDELGLTTNSKNAKNVPDLTWFGIVRFVEWLMVSKLPDHPHITLSISNAKKLKEAYEAFNELIDDDELFKAWLELIDTINKNDTNPTEANGEKN